MDTAIATDASVEGINVAAAGGERLSPVAEAKAVAGVGLAGDRYATGAGEFSDQERDDGSRQLTLIEAEALEAAAAEYGIEVAGRETRRNVVTRGVRLNDLVGERFWVGEALCEGVRLAHPCAYVQKVSGKPLLEALTNRGGLRAMIVEGGRIAVGDAIRSA